MRSSGVQQIGMFSYVSMKDPVSAHHPIRRLRVMVDTLLSELDEMLAAPCTEADSTETHPS